jgi:sugar lactone lactonase YvrE
VNYLLTKKLSGKGTASHQFVYTLPGIAIDGNDNVYAAGDSVVKVFGPEGELLRSWATAQPGLGLGLDGETVYVGEQEQVEVFDRSGQLVQTWREPELMGRVTAISFAADDILVADSKARCIRRFDNERKFINNIGDKNRMKGFNIPNGAIDFAVDSANIIHACNPGKHRVERYTSDGELLGHIGRFDGRDPEGFPGCCNPTNVTVTNRGLLYVTEKAGPRAKVLNSDGKLVTVIATDVFDPNCKNMDVAVDSRGWVYVVDTVRLEINVFRPESENEKASLVV